MKTLSRTLIALCAAVGLYLIVKKVFVALTPGGWDRIGIVRVEILLFAIVAGSVIATELVRLTQSLLKMDQTTHERAIEFKDLFLLLASMASSFLIVIALLAIARGAGVPFQ